MNFKHIPSDVAYDVVEYWNIFCNATGQLKKRVWLDFSVCSPVFEPVAKGFKNSNPYRFINEAGELDSASSEGILEHLDLVQLDAWMKDGGYSLTKLVRSESSNILEDEEIEEYAEQLIDVAEEAHRYNYADRCFVFMNDYKMLTEDIEYEEGCFHPYYRKEDRFAFYCGHGKDRDEETSFINSFDDALKLKKHINLDDLNRYTRGRLGKTLPQYLGIDE